MFNVFIYDYKTKMSTIIFKSSKKQCDEYLEDVLFDFIHSKNNISDNLFDFVRPRNHCLTRAEWNKNMRVWAEKKDQTAYLVKEMEKIPGIVYNTYRVNKLARIGICKSFEVDHLFYAFQNHLYASFSKYNIVMDELKDTVTTSPSAIWKETCESRMVMGNFDRTVAELNEIAPMIANYSNV